MSRNKGQNDVQVEVHRGNSICLNKVTSKFTVTEIMEIAPLDTIAAARNAIDRHIAELNKGVRRKVLTFTSKYYSGDREGRQIRRGELTSWTRPRGYGNRIEGVVMFANDRENFSPEGIYEDTPENLALMEKVLELDRQAMKAGADAEKIIEKELARAAMPAHLKVSDQ